MDHMETLLISKGTTLLPFPCCGAPRELNACCQKSKIHKDPVNPSGRPIVSGHSSILSPSANLLDKAQRDFAMSSKSYLQDTTDIFNKIKNITVPKDTLLVTFGVAS